MKLDECSGAHTHTHTYPYIQYKRENHIKNSCIAENNREDKEMFPKET